MDERWKETYDQWKCATPPEHEGEDEADDYTCIDEGIEDERDEWVLACGYPGCCMPGYHFRSECHNAEDMEAMYEEHEQSGQRT